MTMLHFVALIEKIPLNIKKYHETCQEIVIANVGSQVI